MKKFFKYFKKKEEKNSPYKSRRARNKYKTLKKYEKKTAV